MCRPTRGVRSPRAQLEVGGRPERGLWSLALSRCRLVRRGSASAARRTRHSRCSRSDPPRTHDAPLSCSGWFPPFPLLPAVLFLARGSHPFLGRPFFLPTCFALRRAPRRPHARTSASPRTDDRRTNDATCGPQAWLTGRLHYGGIRSVRSPLRRPPLLATPIATPLQCGRPKRSGLLVS